MRADDLLIALNCTPGISRAACCRLGLSLSRWMAGVQGGAVPSHAATLGVPAGALRAALDLRQRAAELAAEERRKAQSRGCSILTLADNDYPGELRDLALPPPALYVRGRLPPAPRVAIVGARRMNAYGRQTADRFAHELAAAGLPVVSGFAVGIDAVAHRSALDSPGATTVAVHGCGLDATYPRGHGPLARAIAQRGASLSEFPFGAPPDRWRFPVRNRLIAALSEAVLVIQAASRSGSLNTAHHALELGRDIFAVPGRIDDNLARGTNDLLADGALMARNPEDLLTRLLPRQARLFPDGGQPAESSGEQCTEPLPTALPEGLAGRVLAALTPGEAATAEELATALELSVDKVLGELLELELSGWVSRLPGSRYQR